MSPLAAGAAGFPLLAAMRFLGRAVLVAHRAAGQGHMGDGMAMYLAVMTAGAAAVLGLTRTAAERLRTPLSVLVPLAPTVTVAPRLVLPPRIRSGPAALQVFPALRVGDRVRLACALAPFAMNLTARRTLI